MASATADAMKTAAGNENGAMMGFMGANMTQAFGANAMGAAANIEAAGGAVAAGEGAKFCTECGKPVTGKFCASCGAEVK